MTSNSAKFYSVGSRRLTYLVLLYMHTYIKYIYEHFIRDCWKKRYSFHSIIVQSDMKLRISVIIGFNNCLTNWLINWLVDWFQGHFNTAGYFYAWRIRKYFNCTFIFISLCCCFSRVFFSTSVLSNGKTC